MSTDIKKIKHLNADEKQGVQYCIPLWLRDEQIMAAIKRVPGRIRPGAKRDDAVAVVGFGPSLQDTWEELHNYEHIITCSGSHKFLVERGIIPTYHVEVDPRPHKVALIGAPHTDVTYLIASTCHAKVFDLLEGMNVLLWHVFDTKEEGLRILPAGEWALTGGCDVGSRALTIAGFLGFRNVHVFGMDGCAKKEGSGMKHADVHPNEPKGYSITTYKGVEYHTTPGMLEAARNLWHELDQMPLVRATFHGEGLVQAMARDYKRKKAVSPLLENALGFKKELLITPEYVALNAQLHRENLLYGVGGGRYAAIVQKLAAKLETTSVLDYGCGKGYLAKALAFPIWEYDPALPEKAAAPRSADIVVCTDVLEHIEPECIRAVLGDLKRLTRVMGYLVIHTGPSTKTLADGRNSHVLQRDRGWWKKKLGAYFAVAQIWDVGPLLHIVVAPLAKKTKDAKIANEPLTAGTPV